MRDIRKVSCAVTGGAGFLGSHLVNHLIDDRSCHVVVIDNLCAGRREFVHPHAEFIHADITDSEDYLRRVFKEHKVQYVYSVAAAPYVPDSYARPSHVSSVNFHGAMNVINAAEEAGCTGILQVSSAEVYGESFPDLRGRIDEEYPVFPHSTYGASKAAIDFYVQCRWKEAKTPCLAVRQFNSAGARDLFHAYVIPEIILQLHHYGNVVRLGNNSSRDFMDAGDAVRMWVELLEKGSYGEVYNLGSESSIKIYDLAARIGKLMGIPNVQIEQDPSKVRAWEIWSLCASVEKIHSIISYRPKVGLDEMLTNTIKSIKEHSWSLPWFDSTKR